MKITLSKREKVLLFSVGLIGVIYLAVQFGFVPLFQRLVIAQGNVIAYSAEAAMTKIEINNYPLTEDANKAALERYEELKAIYPVLVPTEDMDTVMTNLCLSNSLRPNTWRVAPVTVPRSQDGEDGPQLFSVYTVTMNVTGTFESLLRLLDAVDKQQYIRVSNLSYSDRSTRDDNALPEESAISLTFELTYINPQ